MPINVSISGATSTNIRFTTNATPIVLKNEPVLITDFGTVTINAISANGTVGSNGQVLTSNGSTIYWANSSGSGISFTAGNGLSLTSNVLFVVANSGIIANSSGTFVDPTYIATLTSNNANYLGGVTLAAIQNSITLNAAAAYTNAVAYAASNSYVNSTFQTMAGLASNVVTLTSNNTNFVGSVTAANVVSNAQLQANLLNYTPNTTVYSTFAQNTSVYSVFAQNTAIYTYAASNSYVNSTFQTMAGLSANVATLTSNNTNFVGTVSAANVVSNTQLQSNLANYTPNTTVYSTFAQNVAVYSVFAQNTAIYAYAASNTTVYSTFAQNTAVNSLITANAATAYTNAVTYAATIAGTAYSNAVAYAASNTAVYSTFAQNTAIYAYAASNAYVNSTFQTVAGLSANVATLTSNNTSFVGTVTAANVVSNAQLQANLLNYTPNTTVYSTFAQNTAIYAYAASNAYVNSTFQTIAGLASNVATLTSNNTNFVGTVSAANVVSNTQLQSNLAGYQTTSGLNANIAAYLPTYTGVVAGSNLSISGGATVSGNLTVTGNLTLAGSTTFINATVITTNDLNIILANSASTNTLANNSGLIIGTSANLVYNSSYPAWQSNVAFVPYSNNLNLGYANAAWNIYATAISSNTIFGRTVNAATYVATSNLALTSTANLTIASGAAIIDTTGSQGTVGQVLTSNGTGNVYWSTVIGLNVSAQYTFSNTITFTQVINGTANAANYIGTLPAANVVSNAQLQANLLNYTPNTTVYSTFAQNTSVYSVFAQNTAIYTYAASNAYVNSTFQTVAGLSSNVATLTSNNTSFVGSVSAANVVSNAQLQANLLNYTPNTTVYSTFAQNTAIYAYAASNTYVNSTFAQNTAVYSTFAQNTAIYAYAASNSYVNSTFQTVAGLAANVATLTSNNTTYLNGQLASYYTNATNISTGTLPYAQLPANVVFWSNTNTFTANQTFNANISVVNVYSTGTVNASVYQTGAYGTATAQSLVNSTFIVTGNTTTNVVIGFNSTDSSLAEFALNSNTFAEVVIWNANTGNNASGDFIVNDTLGPEPTSSNYIDVGINGNGFSQSTWTINGPSDGYLYTGNTNLSVGTAGATSYINFFTGGTLATNERMRITNTAIVVNTGIGISANGSTGTSGQVLTSSGTGNVYWSTASSSKRVVSYANSSTFTANTDSTDIATMIYTGSTGTFTIANTTGTPINGQQLVFRIQTTNSQTLSFQAQFAGSTDLPLPSALSGSSKHDYLGFIYNSTTSTWQLLAKNFGF